MTDSGIDDDQKMRDSNNWERFKTLEAASIQAASDGLKALLMLNGGACVALLAFTANIATSAQLRPEFIPLVPAVTKSLFYFGSGAGFAVLGCFFAYYANQRYANSLLASKNKTWKRGQKLNILGGIIAALALAAFFKGLADIAFAYPWSWTKHLTV